jgi:uncharacterized YigZ family protein
MRKEYMTVSKEATAELEEKKSRFIATVKPTETEEEAHSFIQSIKTKYWNATHNVYAYYMCGNSQVQKFSDDGEPSGTAGLPVLEAIKKLGVEDVTVVVTRYFGGTLLGASGLVRAYGKCASLGIEASGIIKRQLCFETKVGLDYSMLGKIQSLVAENGYKIKDTVYSEDVNMYLYVPVDELDKFTASITEATSARALVTPGEKSYITVGG